MIRAAFLAIIILLSVVVIVLTHAIVRLENYRYANFVGLCSEYNIAGVSRL